MSANFEQVFLDSANEVLETMFFTCVGSEGTLEWGERLVSAELKFEGPRTGRFGLRVPSKSGVRMAANFLGVEEVSEKQAAEVICELTNMLCGSVLSRLEAQARFELRHPELDQANTDWRTPDDAIGYTFGTEEGTLTMWISFAQPEIVRPAA